MEKELAELSQRALSNTRRIDALEAEQKDIRDLVTSVALIAQKQESMEQSINHIQRDVEALTEKPAKRWETLVSAIISVVVGALLGYIFSRLGM